MGWVRVSDDFYDQRKFYGVTALGDALWIRGLAFANRNLTDGFIPKRAVKGLIDTTGLSISVDNFTGRDASPEDAVTELLTADIWHESGHDCESCPDVPRGVYLIHDYLDFQPSREKVLEERDRVRGRVQNHREKKRKSGVTDDVTAGVTDDVRAMYDRPQPQPQPQLRLNKVSQVLNRETCEIDSEISVINSSLKGLGVSNFTKLHAELVNVTGRSVTVQQAYEIVLDLLSRASGIVEKPQAYLLTAIKNSWAELQQSIDEGAVA
ncbi:hypothetical protein M2118_000450 [Aurantimicrobium minutum]|uniref:hypothetical protein n=1 Tax=Aurantimicrobium minutum TaxID=708131 RepID=UPI002475F508|nr:hypothetical protein [Aurantimicrobium minutum]MDH6277499.1 hypothetical protein [Aurantimicrobium minutum]